MPTDQGVAETQGGQEGADDDDGEHRPGGGLDDDAEAEQQRAMDAFGQAEHVEGGGRSGGLARAGGEAPNAGRGGRLAGDADRPPAVDELDRIEAARRSSRPTRSTSAPTSTAAAGPAAGDRSATIGRNASADPDRMIATNTGANATPIQRCRRTRRGLTANDMVGSKAVPAQPRDPRAAGSAKNVAQVRRRTANWRQDVSFDAGATIGYNFVAARFRSRRSVATEAEKREAEFRDGASGSHILVVDDHREIRDLLARYLAKNGLARQHGERRRQKCASRLRAAAVDLIVLDIMMPGEDGLSLCRQLRQTSDVPVVAADRRFEETDRIVGLELGADDYVTKPFNPRELLARDSRDPAPRLGAAAGREKPRQAGRYEFDPWILDAAAPRPVRRSRA